MYPNPILAILGLILSLTGFICGIIILCLEMGLTFLSFSSPGFAITVGGLGILLNAYYLGKNVARRN